MILDCREHVYIWRRGCSPALWEIRTFHRERGLDWPPFPVAPNRRGGSRRCVDGNSHNISRARAALPFRSPKRKRTPGAQSFLQPRQRSTDTIPTTEHANPRRARSTPSRADVQLQPCSTTRVHPTCCMRTSTCRRAISTLCAEPSRHLGQSRMDKSCDCLFELFMCLFTCKCRASLPQLHVAPCSLAGAAETKLIEVDVHSASRSPDSAQAIMRHQASSDITPLQRQFSSCDIFDKRARVCVPQGPAGARKFRSW